MSIEEINEKKSKLEVEVNRIISDFNKETGLQITKFEPERLEISDTQPPLYYFIPIIEI